MIFVFKWIVSQKADYSYGNYGFL